MVEHIFGRCFLFFIPPEIRTVEGLSAVFAFGRCKYIYAPKCGALSTALYPDWILCRGEAACILRRHGYYSTECKELSSKKEGVAAGWDICFLRGFWCVCRCLASLDCGGFENEFRLIYNWGAVYCYVWVCAGGCGDAAAAFNREERNGAAGIGEMCRETRPGGGFGPRTSTPLSCQSGKAVCCKAKAPASGHYLALDSQ